MKLFGFCSSDTTLSPIRDKEEEGVISDNEGVMKINELTQAKVKAILPLLDGISSGQIEYILDRVKREVTCYPVRIQLSVD